MNANDSRIGKLFTGKLGASGDVWVSVVAKQANGAYKVRQVVWNGDERSPKKAIQASVPALDFRDWLREVDVATVPEKVRARLA